MTPHGHAVPARWCALRRHPRVAERSCHSSGVNGDLQLSPGGSPRLPRSGRLVGYRATGPHPSAPRWPWRRRSALARCSRCDGTADAQVTSVDGRRVRELGERAHRGVCDGRPAAPPRTRSAPESPAPQESSRARAPRQPHTNLRWRLVVGHDEGDNPAGDPRHRSGLDGWSVGERSGTQALPALQGDVVDRHGLVALVGDPGLDLERCRPATGSHILQSHRLVRAGEGGRVRGRRRLQRLASRNGATGRGCRTPRSRGGGSPPARRRPRPGGPPRRRPGPSADGADGAGRARGSPGGQARHRQRGRGGARRRGSSPLLVSSVTPLRRSAARAWWVRALTVPSRQPRARAVSATERSAK